MSNPTEVPRDSAQTPTAPPPAGLSVVSASAPASTTTTTTPPPISAARGASSTIRAGGAGAMPNAASPGRSGFSPLFQMQTAADVTSSSSSSSSSSVASPSATVANLSASPASLGSQGQGQGRTAQPSTSAASATSHPRMNRQASGSSSTSSLSSVGTAGGGAGGGGEHGSGGSAGHGSGGGGGAGVRSARAHPRHLSGTAFTMSRPVSPPTASARDRFEAAVATSNLASSSSGLQALLRDHPELVSSSLAAAAGPGLQEFSQVEAKRAFGTSAASTGTGTASTSGSRANSVHDEESNPATPAVEDGADPMASSYVGRVMDGAPGIGEGGRGGPASTGSHVHTPSYERREAQLGAAGAKPDYSQKIVVATVGLPARGKSYLSNKLMRYLRWLEYDVKVFNVGQLRRALAQAKLKNSGVREQHTADFFDPNNPIGANLRKQMAEECLEQLIGWLKRGGNVGILDATNSTRSRRKYIAERVSREPGMTLVFLESICTDPAVIAANIAVKVSSGDPDYANMDPEDAKRDFIARIKQYETSYETVDKENSEAMLSYCKITDVGRSVIINQFHGYLESRIAFYLMNLHLTPRNIFFSRHGESQFNVQGKIGGDSDLSERGWAYARALPQLIKDNIGDKPLTVWHSTLRRTAQTASFLPYPKLAWKSLDELDAGVCDGMTYEEIEEYFPEDYASRDEDKFNYRYRGGESYRDVVVRLEPVIMELERQENILIVGHQAILRALYAYFHSLSQEELPYIKIPLHTVIQLTPKAYGCDEKRFRLPIEA
ncbi:Fructose-2,6-bisphosphatase [Tilletia horrida]|uniref:fructose-2,6-bisphosphate 2-phosphatase n=1 Tax=Tilletia horrida TaxID=155126 RepID=A0AAN6GB75_9BASI|nr:Fructose-2,6-bisphosphatase [Tilletia horrida]KAK0533671.1 Fructose-2,6-bisphosphatase [Tilletia horrida]